MRGIRHETCQQGSLDLEKFEEPGRQERAGRGKNSNSDEGERKLHSWDSKIKRAEGELSRG